ncbi:hypothetical protein AGOR_G00155880 [Albula goreensis]|uniref:Uncharacterized protein n=1 Tax=Albula goreensis TaxID=1534307 RepID=A0A8T3D4K6_9TELE|nr:hypothetical protein AGOR_G00155880 [Albula goreensis]
MNTHKRAQIFCKAKARRQCFFLILCFHLVLGDVPGPCRHSVTKDHLLKIKRLIENQLQNGCSITYTFTERQSLSKICYVKAAFPQILDLLNTHFQYVRSSDNYRYVFALKNLVFNIYSQKCIPEINEEIEDNPVRFVKDYRSSLKEALGKIREVIQLYMELMTENNKPVDWNCEEEYAEDYPESTTALAQTTGTTECHCSCPTLGHGASEQVSLPDTSLWNNLPQSSYLQSHSSILPKMTQQPMGTMHPWDSLPANHDSHQRLEATNSNITSDRKKSGDISSSPKSAFPRTAMSGSSIGSFDENGGIPQDMTAQYLRVRLDSVPSAPRTFNSMDETPVTAESKQGMNVFESTYIPTTPIPFQEAPAGSTPNKPEESTGVVLAKRSLGPKVEGLQSSSGTAPPLLKTWIPTYSPLESVSRDNIDKSTASEDIIDELNNLAATPQAGKQARTPINTIILPTTMLEDTFSSLTARQSHDPLAPRNSFSPVEKHESVSSWTTDAEVESPGIGLQSSANIMDSDSSEQPIRDSGNDFQNGTQGGSHMPYKIAFITASVCGGLLLILTLYCFKQQRKLKALLHSSKMKENQRLTSFSADIEMQHCEITEQSGLNSS